MAQERNMAEATPNPISDAVLARFAEAATRPPEPPRPPEDPLLTTQDRARILEEARVNGGSRFSVAQAEYAHYMRLSVIDQPTEDLQTALGRRREGSRQAIERFHEEAEAEPSRFLTVVMDRIVDLYDRVRKTRNSELTGRDRQQAIEIMRQHGQGELERIFSDYIPYNELGTRYGRLPSYMLEGVAVETDTDENDRKSPDGSRLRPLNALAEKIFLKVKRLREIKRLREKNIYEQEESHWGGKTYYSFGWPETARDMIRTTVAWVKDRIEGLGTRRDTGTVFGQIEENRREGVALLETCRLRINREEKLSRRQIKETNPKFLRARAFAEGPTDVIGNDLAMREGDIESGPKLKKRFGSDFIANHRAMYLENSTAAYIMHLITKRREGTYWLGHGWNVEKAEEGAVIDYRQEIEFEIVDDAATHDLFTETIFAKYQDLFQDFIKAAEEQGKAEGGDEIGKVRKEEVEEDIREGLKGFFELREEYQLDYSFDDPLERMLLDSDNQIRDRIAVTGDPEALRRHTLRVAVFRRTKEILDEREGLGFVNNDERRLMERRKHRERPLINIDEELVALAAFKRNIRRGQIQQEMRVQGLDEPQIAAQREQIEIRIRQEMGIRRQVVLGERMRRQMATKIQGSFLAKDSTEAMVEYDSAKAAYDAAVQAQDSQGATEALANCNRICWEWMKAYNEYRIDYHVNRWYPSGWDKVRMKIDRSTKVIDRTLSEEEFEAMYEEMQLPEASEDRLKDIIEARREEARFGFQLAKTYQEFLMQDTLLGGMRTRLIDPKTGEYIGKLSGDDEETAWVNKHLGLTDANGDVINSERKLVRVFDVIQARLQKAIEDEAKLIEDAKEAKAIAIASGNRAEINRTTAELRDMLVNSQFVATHALKAKGLVEGKLPVWSFNYLDRNSLYVFTEALADYGLEVAPGNYMDHNRKKEFYEILVRGMRAWDSEGIRALKEFMVGTYPVFERDADGRLVLEQAIDKNGKPTLRPRRAISLFTAASDYGDPVVLSERFRIVNKGAPPEDTQVTDAGYDISTSGGVIAYELGSSMGRLGFNPMLIWFGITSIRELNNYIAGQDEVAAHNHKLFNVHDFPDNADAQAAAYIARKTLTGGKISEIAGAARTGGITPGFLNEIFLKSTNIAEVLQKNANDFSSIGMKDTAEYASFLERWRRGDHRDEKGNILSYEAFNQLQLNQEFTHRTKETTLDALNQMTYLDFDKMNREMINELYYKWYETISYFLYYLAAEKDVEQIRIPGNATRTWNYNCTLRWYAFRRVLREAMAKGEQGLVLRSKFSPEAASEISIRYIQRILEDADYIILKYYERERLSIEGSEILSRALNDTERAEGGFEINGEDENGDPVSKRTFVIPDEKDWGKLVRPEVRKALENIRRRGLLEFMTEEGYSIFDVDDKGRIKRDWPNLSPEVRQVLKKIEGKGALEIEGGKYAMFDVDDEGNTQFDNGTRIPLLRVLGNEMPPLVQQQKVTERKSDELRLVAAAA